MTMFFTLPAINISFREDLVYVDLVCSKKLVPSAQGTGLGPAHEAFFHSLASFSDRFSIWDYKPAVQGTESKAVGRTGVFWELRMKSRHLL